MEIYQPQFKQSKNPKTDREIKNEKNVKFESSTGLSHNSRSSAGKTIEFHWSSKKRDPFVWQADNHGSIWVVLN